MEGGTDGRTEGGRGGERGNGEGGRREAEGVDE